MQKEEYVFTNVFGVEKQREKKECKLTSMEEEGTEDTPVVDMGETVVVDTAETAVVDMVVGADTEDVEEDTVAMVVATEATTVAALGVALMLVRLFRLSQRVLSQLTRKSCIYWIPHAAMVVKYKSEVK